jgi:hypothetical protein
MKPFLSDIDLYSGMRPDTLRLSRNKLSEKAADAFTGVFSGLLSQSFGPCRFKKIQTGNRDAVIVVNGFMSQGLQETCDWETVIRARYPSSTIYHLDWDAAKAPLAALQETISARRRSPLRNAMPFFEAVGYASAWHRAMLSAETAGRTLAEAIYQTPGWNFTLAGHSLGARVIHFALKAIAQRGSCTIDDAYLLGGAVGGGAKDDACWTTATRAVKGKIYNCHSSRDDVLRWAYQGANGMRSSPAGLAGIHLQHDRIVQLNCSDFVGSHMQWKDQFDQVLWRLKRRADYAGGVT